MRVGKKNTIAGGHSQEVKEEPKTLGVCGAVSLKDQLNDVSRVLELFHMLFLLVLLCWACARPLLLPRWVVVVALLSSFLGGE